MPIGQYFLMTMSILFQINILMILSISFNFIYGQFILKQLQLMIKEYITLIFTSHWYSEIPFGHNVE